ncbi:uncharacterized protein [Aristolochia californica]|uniref:uncharacterized protein n=1 Tax=Aristolochia californica TaxID=171875 RepID=UPI0035DD2FA1
MYVLHFSVFHMLLPVLLKYHPLYTLDIGEYHLTKAKAEAKFIEEEEEEVEGLVLTEHMGRNAPINKANQALVSDTKEEQSTTTTPKHTFTDEDYELFLKMKTMMGSSPSISSLTTATTGLGMFFASSSSWIIDSEASEHLTGKGSTSVTPSLLLTNILFDLTKKWVIGGGREQGGHYYLDVPQINNASTCNTESRLWHNQLGHMSAQSLHHIFPKAKLDLHCEACQMSKHQRSTYSPRPKIKSVSPFSLIHTDVWGPWSVSNISQVCHIFLDSPYYSDNAPPGLSSVPGSPQSVVPHAVETTQLPETLIDTPPTKLLDPTESYEEALKHPGWKTSMDEEMHALYENQTWVLVPLPSDKKLVDTLKGKVILVIYVDDIIITGSDLEGIQKTKERICTEFKTKDLELLKYFLGIEVLQSVHGIILSERKYVLDLLEVTGMLGCILAETLMDSNKKLCAGTGEEIDAEKYQILVGRLIYLYVTKPYISHVVSVLLNLWKSEHQ